MKDYLSRSWISPKLAAGPSSIHDVGVLAMVPIAAGERLMEFGGQKISGEEAAGGRYRARSVWTVADDTYLALLKSDPVPSLDENLNHSCDANCWLDDEVVLSAKRDIAAGEEITLDQGTWNFEEEDYACDRDFCTCGAPDCRINLTMGDWALPALQERYRDHFHPLIQRLLDGSPPDSSNDAAKLSSPESTSDSRRP